MESIWPLFGAVKTEFGKFGDVISATQKKLVAATNQFGEVNIRSRAIQRKLCDFAALPLIEDGHPPLPVLASVDED